MSTQERPTKSKLKDEARRAGRSLGRLDYRRPEYPHGIHPALVPGISIDEQRRRYGLSRTVFVLAGVLTVIFVIWGVADPEGVATVAQAAFDWSTTNVSWLFNSVAIIVLLVLLVIACSPYGRIPLGKDGEEPEFSTFAWVSMLFAAGIGIGVLFFGPSEPLTYFVTPPPLTAEPESVEALHGALAQTYFHWGFHAWAMYALVGGAVAYSAYRRGRSLLMSSVFRSMFGARRTDGFAGKLVDSFAIIATLFGTAAALGIAAMQIGTGVSIVTGVGELTTTLLVVILLVLTAGFIVSAVSGVARGIRYLSSINIVLTVGIVGIVLVLGPTLFLLNLLPSAMVEYVGSMFDMMGRSLSWGEETQAFQSAWTVYYWAWWISWSPFVGIFIARISRGRTVRQFLLGTILIPSTMLFVAFGVMGGTSMWMYREGLPGFAADLAPAQVFFTMIDNLDYVAWVPYVAIVVLSIFFITSADSASVVMGMLSSRGDQSPRRGVVVFWGLVMSGIAVVMLSLGDATALQGLQQLVIVTAVPFALVMLLIVVAWVRDLRTDPATLRHLYAQSAVQHAVIEGVQKHGDDFSLQVGKAGPGDGAGAHIDSEDESYTDWYQRRDEDGEPVGYSYETGEWEDGWTADGEDARREED
ncbi:High-affinity choline uptake protein BetT [Serinicoccus hydrothermalis]|uniref:High-affinity choline uptake protein BetT n=1 Tax=Serinicoccus hydrothermalis TaxID=1758689 RepID=A0A1B1N8R1_9MICO|nr:BCCT family transporter [Serinicoccus hydrothermalis]ANS77809.1 High-affinity choline uptake protein BetT [Serinicoccus hydrothermalis]